MQFTLMQGLESLPERNSMDRYRVVFEVETDDLTQLEVLYAMTMAMNLLTTMSPNIKLNSGLEVRRLA